MNNENENKMKNGKDSERRESFFLIFFFKPIANRNTSISKKGSDRTNHANGR